MKINLTIPNVVTLKDFEVEYESFTGGCVYQGETEVELFGRSHRLTFTVEILNGVTTLYYTIYENEDDEEGAEFALRDFEFEYEEVR